MQENLSGKLFRGTPTTTITKTGTSAVQSSAMSSSFDENDEEEDNHKILSNTAANKTNDSIFKFNQINRIQYNNANNNSSSSNILQTFSTKTANRILQWMSANWNDTDYNFSSIDARRYLPPIYQSSKNIAKTIRVS